MPWAAQSHRVWLITAAVLFGVMMLAGGVMVGRQLRHQPTPPAAQPAVVPTDPLVADFAALQARLQVAGGVAFGPVGTGRQPMVLGDWQTGPAWSTIKIPLVIAALRQEHPPAVTPAMSATITASDNDAAESIWASLGEPAAAAQKVEAVLREYGDPTIVQSHRVRPEFSASGQTDWPLADQVRFTAAAVCDNANAPVFDLMRHVEADQKWGLGSMPDSRFKGGWGPAPNGRYLVRQLGVIATPNGLTAVALAALPASGRFGDGTAALSAMAAWLTSHLDTLPAGRCAG